MNFDETLETVLQAALERCTMRMLENARRNRDFDGEAEPLEPLWLTERNSRAFTSRGYKCVIKRSAELKHLNGYVALPRSHFLWGKEYDACSCEYQVPAHVEWTFAEPKSSVAAWHLDGYSIDDDAWIFGFDCAQAEDFIPALPDRRISLVSGNLKRYRDMDYVESKLKAATEKFFELAQKHDTAQQQNTATQQADESD